MWLKEIILSGPIVISLIGNSIENFKMATKRKTNSLTIKCGVPEGSFLGQLLFIVYVNDLYRASNILKSIMFVNDTNLFCSGKHIKTLFQTANIELEKIAIWFQANKLSLNESRTKFTFLPFFILTKMQ